MSCPDLSGTFVRWLQAFLGYFGLLIGRYPGSFLSVTCILSLLCTAGLYKLEIASDVREEYTPDGSPSLKEWEVYKDFFGQTEPFNFKIFLQATDRGSMLRQEYLHKIVEINDYVINGYFVYYNGASYRLKDFCGPYCRINDVVVHFSLGLDSQIQQLAQNKSLSSHIRLQYPITTILGQSYNVGPYFFGVRQTVPNATKPTTIENVQLILLHYRADRPTKEVGQTLNQWERNIPASLEKFQTGKIEMLLLSESLIKTELIRMGVTIVPYLLVGFLFTFIFAIGTILFSASLYDQTHWTKFVIALAAVMSPLMAVGVGMGTLCWAGYKFSPVLSGIPYLVLAIGVDDAFLMIHCWQRLVSSENSKDTQSVAHKLAYTLHEVGPSITITSVTNALAFGIGAFTPTPTIRLFCAATAICISVDLIFELTGFGAVLVLCGRFDKVPMIGKGQNRSPRLVAMSNATVAGLKIYCKTLQHRVALAIVLMLIVLHVSFATVGVYRMKAELTPKKLFLFDSPLIEVDNLREQYTWNEYYELTVLVNNPPDVSNSSQLHHFMTMVKQFETMEGALGRNFTELWLPDYLTFHKAQTDCDHPFLSIPCNMSYDSLAMFMKWPEFSKWDAYVHWQAAKYPHNSEYTVDSFAFTTAFVNMSSWTKRVDLMAEWRALCHQNAQFQVAPFEPDSYLLDQIASLKPTTLSTVLITFICMALVCALFIPSLSSVVFASLAIVSISLGVVGWLSWWSIDLDPLSMTMCIMSIGFSVDYTAHVSFHYFKTGQEGITCPEERLFVTLKSVGWPMVQAGLSTLLVVSALMFIAVYMAEAMLKTFLLVVGLGLLHGLLFLPVILSALPPWMTGGKCTCVSRIHSISSSHSGVDQSTTNGVGEN